MAAEDGSVILSFDDFTFWYDTALFQIDTILGGMYCDVFWYPDYDNEGNVLVKGNLKDNMDTTSLTVEDGWVLLFRATLTPATMIPTGAAMYSSEVTTLGITAPVGVDFSGIVAMVLTTAKDGEETIGGALAETPDELLTYPVIYDVVHDNRIDLRDFSVFIKAFGKNKKDIDPELWEKYAQCDFVPDGVINLKDFQLFIKAFGRTKETGIRNDIIPVPPPIPAPAATLAPSVSAGLMVMEGAATEGEPPALVGGYHAAVLSAELGAFPLSLSAADTMYTDRAVKPAAVLPIDTAILAVVDTIDMFDFSAKVAETEFNVLNAVGVLEW